jgi:anti-sigma factor RsiW
MHNCDSLDPLVTPFVDGELPDADRRAVEEHLGKCPPCYSRVAAERAVHEVLRARRGALCKAEAPDSLHLRCASLVRRTDSGIERTPLARTSNPEPSATDHGPRTVHREPRTSTPFASRVAPLAMAASLVMVVGGAFLYQATDKSASVLAAQLVADHAKCFALNAALGTHQTDTVVEQSMASSFSWHMHLPSNPANEGLELVGARPCMYGEGKIAHIMYRHDGQPVSLFMLPETTRAAQLVEVLGHEAAIWCANNRTFVLVAREPRPNVEHIAQYVQASLH